MEDAPIVIPERKMYFIGYYMPNFGWFNVFGWTDGSRQNVVDEMKARDMNNPNSRWRKIRIADFPPTAQFHIVCEKTNVTYEKESP